MGDGDALVVGAACAGNGEPGLLLWPDRFPVRGRRTRRRSRRWRTRLPRDAVWIASPLQRTADDGGGARRRGRARPGADPGPGLAIEPDLIEQNFGAWQGVKYSELHARRGDEWHRFWLAPAHETPPGGESFAALTERVRPRHHAAQREPSAAATCLVSHGGTIRAALALALDLAPEHALAFAVDNLSLTRIEHFPEPGGAHGWRVVAVNQPPQ